MGYPALPKTVDQYVRQMLNTMVGRTGRLGDRVVTFSDLVDAGLMNGDPLMLKSQSSPTQTIRDTLTKPATDDSGNVITPGNEPTEAPTTPTGLKTSGIFGAVIVEWLPPSYSGHSYTEISRAQVDDVTQSSVAHQSESNSYTDVIMPGTVYYYWIRHVNKGGQKSNYNQVAGVAGEATVDVGIIQMAVQGEIDNSYFTPAWATHTQQEEQKLAKAEQDLLAAENLISTVSQNQIDGDDALSQQIATVSGKAGANEASIVTLNQTTATQATSISQLETSDGTQNSQITTLNQTTANQATQITSLTTTTGINTASITEQKTVTDGLKAEYTLKVTQQTGEAPVVTGIGVASGRTEDGEVLSEIAFAAQNFYFSSPDGLKQPFQIVDVGTSGVSDYKIGMNADVLINGRLSVNQLSSGELPAASTFTIGMNSLELSTASDGTGQIIISGSGGIQNNDYMIINAGRISSYVAVPGVGHVPYKEVRRVESGTANSGQQVKIPAYFRSQPAIHLYPRDMSVYNAAYPSQSQKIEISHTAPQPDPAEAGAWLFTPYAKLTLAAGSSTISPGWTYSGANNADQYTASNVVGVDAISTTVRAASFNRTTGTTYNNRAVTITLFYKLSSSSTWIEGDTDTVDIDLFGVKSTTLATGVTLGEYDFEIRFLAADRSGTFTDGNPTYEYSQQGASSATTTYEHIGSRYYTTKSYSISVPMPALTGWEVTSISYTYTVDVLIKVRTLFYYTDSTERKAVGEASIKIPEGQGAYREIVETSVSYVEGGFPWSERQHNNLQFSLTENSIKDGIIRPLIETTTSSGGYGGGGNTIKPTAEISFTVKSLTATVYYRRQQSDPQISNQFYIDTIRYDKAASDVSLDSSVVTWMATSDN